MRFARLLTGDDHRAEDLVQDVLAAAYVRWRRIGAMDRPDLYVVVAIASTSARYTEQDVLTELGELQTVGDPDDPASW